MKKHMNLSTASDSVFVPLPEWIRLLVGAMPVARGWTLAQAQAEAVDAVIEQHRFADDCDRVLARHEGEEGFALFPSGDALRERGINVALLAQLLEAGMVHADGFNDTLRRNSTDTVNGALEHLAEIALENEAHPDPVDRVLCRHGECPDAVEIVPADLIGEAFDMFREDRAPRPEGGPFQVGEVFVVRV